MMRPRPLTAENNTGIALRPDITRQEEKTTLTSGLLFILAGGLIPISIFPRGGFQIADIFISILIIYSLSRKTNITEKVKNHIYLLLPYVLWVILVSGSYFLYYKQFGILLIAINMTYAFFMLYAFGNIWSELIYHKAYNYIYLMLILSLICVFSFKGYQEWEGVRFSFSFNNPNQLGLYALILQSIVLLLMKTKIESNVKNKIYYLMDIIFIILSHYFAFMAISRGTLAAFIIIDLCLLKNLLSRDLFLPVAGVIALGGLLLLTTNPHFIQERIEARGTQRFSGSAFEERVADAIATPMKDLRGWKIIFGTGHVPSSSLLGQDRIRAGMGQRPLEVHNMFGNVLWSFGFIGLILYASWVFKIIWNVRIIPNALWVWGALLTFSVSGVLIRSRMYWLILGLMIALWNINIIKKAINSSHPINTINNN